MLMPLNAPCAAPDMAVLVNLTKVFINWDVYARTQNLNWRFDRNVCDWTPYVGCQGHNVVSLDFSLSAIDVTGIHPTTPQGLNYQNVHFSSPIRLQGMLLFISDRDVSGAGCSTFAGCQVLQSCMLTWMQLCNIIRLYLHTQA